MSIFDMKTFYVIVVCTLDEYNNGKKIVDPKRTGYYADPKHGVPINVFSHNNEVLISLGFGMKGTFIR